MYKSNVHVYDMVTCFQPVNLLILITNKMNVDLSWRDHICPNVLCPKILVVFRINFLLGHNTKTCLANLILIVHKA
jgi:hypothetical protein